MMVVMQNIQWNYILQDSRWQIQRSLFVLQVQKRQDSQVKIQKMI